MRGSCLAFWAVPHSTTKRPSVKVAVMDGVLRRTTSRAQASSVRASTSARNGLLAAARTLVPGGNADAIGGAGSPDELVEADVVEAAHEAGDEVHALRRRLSLGVQSLHEQKRDAVAGHAAVGDHAAHDDGPALPVLRRFPLESDGTGVAGDGDTLGGMRAAGPHPGSAGEEHGGCGRAPGGLARAGEGTGGRLERGAEEAGPLKLPRSEEHTSELQSLRHLVCRLLLEKKKKK